MLYYCYIYYGVIWLFFSYSIRIFVFIVCVPNAFEVQFSSENTTHLLLTGRPLVGLYKPFSNLFFKSEILIYTRILMCILKDTYLDLILHFAEIQNQIFLLALLKKNRHTTVFLEFIRQS